MSYQAPPQRNIPDPEGMHGWTKVQVLFAHRWPEWEPTDQERRDWLRVMKNWDWDQLDEAMLEVKMRYSSKIPQLKWIRDAYYRLRDERQKAQRSQSDLREGEGLAEESRQLELERQECMSRLQALSPDRLQKAIQIAAARYGQWVPSRFPNDLQSMTWMHRFAVLFASESSGDV